MIKKTIFMGTPQFAVPILRALYASDFRPLCIVTQPDRVGGRKNALIEPAVKLEAKKLGYIPAQILQPDSIKTEAFLQVVRAIAPDVIVVAAYGKILPDELLATPSHGCINVHASLLPAYRGASPISAALLAGDKQTGITIIKMDKGMDTGDIISMKKTVIVSTDTMATLSDRLSVLGADLLLETLPAWVRGEIRAEKQNNELASYSKLISKEDGHLDWNKSAITLERQIRAYYPWPGSWALWKERGKRITIHAAVVDQFLLKPKPVGSILPIQERFGIACSTGVLQVHTLQLEGKAPLPADEFLRGYPDFLQATLV